MMRGIPGQRPLQSQSHAARQNRQHRGRRHAGLAHGRATGADAFEKVVLVSIDVGQPVRPRRQRRLNAYGVLRGGGQWRGRTDGADINRDMRVGGGVGARLEIPIHKYVVLGPMFDYHLLNPADITVLGFDIEFENIHALTFGVWSKGRYVLDLAGNPFEVYIGIPMGLSIYAADADGFPEVGVSIGLMFGAQLFINDTFAASTGFSIRSGRRWCASIRAPACWSPGRGRHARSRAGCVASAGVCSPIPPT